MPIIVTATQADQQPLLTGFDMELSMSQVIV